MVASLASLAVPLAASGGEPCRLARVGELPVTMRDMRPLVHAAINGQDALFIADSGAFYNTLTPSAARRFKLPLDPVPGGASGVGGDARAWLTTVKSFAIFGREIPRVPFEVSSADLGGEVVGVLGENALGIGDVEYDLADGMIRILRTHGDCSNESLAYWANARGQPVSAIEIDFVTAEHPAIMGSAWLNGQKIRVQFDTGASESVLYLDAAARAGVTAKSPGVISAGNSSGFGPHEVPTWTGSFASFRIGDEEIRNTRLQFADIADHDTDMLLGADFFLSHHILVANSQHTLYFTYNGGPVFNLATAAAAAQAAPPAAARDSPDAAGYARRGSASASRHDYEHALADLTRAIELDATQADYYYERGAAYAADRQTDKALADFDQAIRLNAGDVPALVARAGLRAERHDPAATIRADLDAADRAAPREADVRVELGLLYVRVRNYPAAIAQYGEWIDVHNSDDAGMARVHAARCWARALMGSELDQALEDCNFAVRRSQPNGDALESRGLVYLRQGKFARAIADDSAALALDPKRAWALYGRGLAQRRLGQTAAGDADVAAAQQLTPKIAEEAASHGIVP